MSKSDGFVVAVNAICFPFGDQAIDSTDFGIDVSARGSPPFIDSNSICACCGFPSFSFVRRNASVFPSGDHRGAVSRGPFVIERGVPPFDDTLQIDVRYFSPFSSTVTRTNAICDPSGDSCGSPIHVNLKRSFSVMLRANAATVKSRTMATKIFFIALCRVQ